MSDIALLKKIFIPAEQRQRVGLSRNIYYDIVEIYENRVVGYFNEQAMIRSDIKHAGVYFFHSIHNIHVNRCGCNYVYKDAVCEASVYT